MKVDTTDLSEGGLAITLPKRSQPQGQWRLNFSLPGDDLHIEVTAEFAWQGNGSQVGLRFVDLSSETEQQLRAWLRKNSPAAEQDDPPVRCQLMDLSLRACYLALSSPFPVSTRLTLSMSASGVDLRSKGVVRLMHPDKGMGVEFVQDTAEHRASFEAFMAALTRNPDAMPDLLVEPEGLETEVLLDPFGDAEQGEDPLLQLFRDPAAGKQEDFLAMLRKQRGLTGAAAAR